MSTRVRERQSDREWDRDSFQGDTKTKKFTTIRRYKVPDRDYDEEEDDFEEDIKITTKDSNGRETRVEVDYERDRERDTNYRENRNVREYRFEREVSRDRSRRRDSDDYEVERYVKTTDVYERPQPQTPIVIRETIPQPIIIKERSDPIIIREAAPEVIIRRESSPARSDVKSVKSKTVISETVAAKSVATSNQQVARRESSSSSSDEENYYYERKTRQIKRDVDSDDDRRSDHRSDQRSRRDVRPRDSASQHSRSSDDESVYWKRTEYGGGSEEQHHRRHLAEGAVAGAGIAALVRHHRAKEGEAKGGRVRNVAGGAALGALGAEVISRARNHYRERSRARSRSRPGSPDVYRPGRRRSLSNEGWDTARLTKYGAIAAIGALAGYAATRTSKGKQVVNSVRRRSRSMRRDSSVGARGRSRSNSARDPSHRNRVVAQAGLASAAVAGLVEHARSKSRGNRSQSAVRRALPVAAVGLGGAALAGLYERQKAKKEEKAARELSPDSFDSRSPSRTRSASRGRESASGDNRGLIEWGNDPISHEDGHGRRRGYSTGSSDSDPRSRRRSRSRGHDITEGAAAAGLAGVAVHEAEQRRRAEREQRRQAEGRVDTPNTPYDFGPYAQPAAQPPPGNYPGANTYYPQAGPMDPYPPSYAPPPGFTQPHEAYGQNAQPAYNPADWAPQNPGFTPQQGHDGYGYPPPGPNGAYPGPGNHVSAPSTAIPEQASRGWFSQSTSISRVQSLMQRTDVEVNETSREAASSPAQLPQPTPPPDMRSPNEHPWDSRFAPPHRRQRWTPARYVPPPRSKVVQFNETPAMLTPPRSLASETHTDSEGELSHSEPHSRSRTPDTYGRSPRTRDLDGEHDHRRSRDLSVHDDDSDLEAGTHLPPRRPPARNLSQSRSRSQSRENRREFSQDRSTEYSDDGSPAARRPSPRADPGDIFDSDDNDGFERDESERDRRRSHHSSSAPRRRNTDAGNSRSSRPYQTSSRSQDYNSNTNQQRSRRTRSESPPGTRRRDRARDLSPYSDASDATIELPDRFDSDGRRKAEREVPDAKSGFAGRIQGMFAGKGKGMAGKLFSRFAGDLMGGSGSSKRN